MSSGGKCYVIIANVMRCDDSKFSGEDRKCDGDDRECVVMVGRWVSDKCDLMYNLMKGYIK